MENKKGKKKELSPQEAALIIQLSFREYLIHRSKVLRALRDLSIAKTKLKEIRESFNNFAYCQRLARDAEERQRFTEKIIVLLLTVDAIEVNISLFFLLVNKHVKYMFVNILYYNYMNLISFSNVDFCSTK